jgi:hypothetical protein
LPEFRALVEAARSFVAGDLHFSHVCAAAAAFDEAVKIYIVDPRVKQIASEWVGMASRAWPEWGQVPDPVTPEEFKEWVQRELSVFEAMESKE